MAHCWPIVMQALYMQWYNWTVNNGCGTKPCCVRTRSRAAPLILNFVVAFGGINNRHVFIHPIHSKNFPTMHSHWHTSPAMLQGSNHWPLVSAWIKPFNSIQGPSSAICTTHCIKKARQCHCTKVISTALHGLNFSPCVSARLVIFHMFEIPSAVIKSSHGVDMVVQHSQSKTAPLAVHVGNNLPSFCDRWISLNIAEKYKINVTKQLCYLKKNIEICFRLFVCVSIGYSQNTQRIPLIIRE